MWKKGLAILVAALLIGSTVLLTMGSDELMTVASAETAVPSYLPGDTLYENNFATEAVGTLPSGWQVGYNGHGASFGWNSSSEETGVSAQIVSTAAGNALEFSAKNNDAYLSLPEVKTRNYLYEAELTVKHSGNKSIGVANNMWLSTDPTKGGVNYGNGVMYLSSPTNTTGSASFKYRGTGSNSATFDLPGTLPKTDTKVKFSILSIDGWSYLSYNGDYFATAPHRPESGTSDWVGFYTYAGTIQINSVKVTEVLFPTLNAQGSSLAVSDEGAVSITAGFTFDKTSKIYQKYYSAADYTAAEDQPLRFGTIVYEADVPAYSDLTAETAGAQVRYFTAAELAQNAALLSFRPQQSVAADKLDKYYNFRPFAYADGTYFYSPGFSANAATLATGSFRQADAGKQALLQKTFADSKLFLNDSAKTLIFTVFSDFHYKEKKYISSPADLTAIFQRAEKAGSAFVLSGGDFCNDFKGSPELIDTFKNYKRADGTVMPAYNVYGNHELETAGNTMAIVTPALTNDSDVIWGTADGKIAPDGSIGYYYFEREGYRVIALDTFYYTDKSGNWHHNESGSYGAPSDAVITNAIGPTQMAWFENVLTDAAEKDVPCIVLMHCGVSGLFSTNCHEAQEVRDLFRKINNQNPGTVLMCINGHAHLNHRGYNDGVFYLDVNVTRNTWWGDDVPHYSADQTFTYYQYDEAGNLVSTEQAPLTSLQEAYRTWFSTDPLSAVVTIDERGVVTVNGMQTTWLYNIAPTGAMLDGAGPEISSGTYWDCDILGHDMHYSLTADGHTATCANPLCEQGGVTEAHVFDREVADDAFLKTPGSCITKTGNVYYKSCVCGAKGEETFVSGTYTHAHTVTEGAEPNTCDTPGWTGQVKCLDCGEIVQENTQIPAGHQLKQVEAKAPTHTQPGNPAYFVCERCGKFFADAHSSEEISGDNLVLPATGHNVPATWTNDALNHWHLCDCGEKFDAAAHTYDEWSVTRAPSTTDSGLRSRTCTVCGYVQTETVAPLAGIDETDEDGSAAGKGDAAAPGDTQPPMGDIARRALPYAALTALVSLGLCGAALLLRKKRTR